MKSGLFQHELGKTSAVFGRKEDVQVVFQGEGAATNGSVIFLPALNDGVEVDDVHQAVMRGYVDHEAGHVRHTNFDVIGRSTSKLERALVNCLEDVRIERKVIDEYPGAERNLKATTEAVNHQFLETFKPDDERLKDHKMVAPVALTWLGREPYGGETCRQALSLLDDDLLGVLPKWVKALDACDNTEDVLTLAKTIAKSLEDEDYREKKPEPEPEAKAEAEGEPESEGEDAGEPEPEGGDGEGEDGAPGDESEVRNDLEPEDGAPESGGEFDKNELGEAAGDVEDKAEVEPFVPEVKDAMKQMLKDSGLTTSGASTYRPLTTAHDKWHHRTDSPRKYGGWSLGHKLNGDASDYDQMVQGMAGDVNVMRRKLERALVAKQMRDWDHGREFGRLDTKRLASAVAGKTNVFKLRSESHEIDTALTMLVDLSGSMAGREAYVAQQCVAAIIEAVDRTGIKYEVLGFNNRTGWLTDVETPKRSDLAGETWGRLEPLDMYVFKAFEERLFEAKGPLSKIYMNAEGNNTDGEAVGYAYERLRKRPEKRKVFMTFSDGYPAARTDNIDGLQKHLRDQIDMLVKDGTDVIGVGIYSDAVKQFYPHWVVVEDVGQLASSAMDLIARVLMGERFVIDNSKLMAASGAI